MKEKRERIKITQYTEALDFANIENPLSLSIKRRIVLWALELVSSCCLVDRTFSFLIQVVMDKNSKIAGIDISKSSFDVYSETEGHQKFENTTSGFKKLVKAYGKDTRYVMESTGCYHVLLALYLSGEGILVSIENPLKIKRFIQMQLLKVKTDKADARMICKYAISQDLKIWKSPDSFQRRSESLFSLLQFYEKQRTSIKNKLHREKRWSQIASATFLFCKSIIFLDDFNKIWITFLAFWGQKVTHILFPPTTTAFFIVIDLKLDY